MLQDKILIICGNSIPQEIYANKNFKTIGILFQFSRVKQFLYVIFWSKLLLKKIQMPIATEATIEI